MFFSLFVLFFFQVIKLDDEFDGRGHAFFDTNSLIIVRSLREAHRKHTTREPNYWQNSRSDMIRTK